jgi:hypothetical protein
LPHGAFARVAAEAPGSARGGGHGE